MLCDGHIPGHLEGRLPNLVMPDLILKLTLSKIKNSFIGGTNWQTPALPCHQRKCGEISFSPVTAEMFLLLPGILIFVNIVNRNIICALGKDFYH